MKLFLKGIKKPDHRLDFDAIYAYGEKLEAQGWICSPGSGGYVSPDGSAIFYTHRSPYYGRVMKNSLNGDYKATVAELYKTGDFRMI